MQELRQKCIASETEIESLRCCSKSERESDLLKRELQFLVMTMQISLAQARADLAEVRTDLDLSFKSINTERMKKNHHGLAESRVDSSPLSVTELGDASSFSNSNRSEVFSCRTLRVGNSFTVVFAGMCARRSGSKNTRFYISSKE